MLVVTRKVNENIQIGNEITITVVRIGPGAVRIGVNAPSHMTVLRGELTAGQHAAAEQGGVKSRAEQRLP